MADAAVPVVRIPRLVATRGDRVGIVGPNGAGKTTLLRTISGQLSPLDGFVRLGAAVQPGYLAQLRGAAIPGATVLDALLAVSNVDLGPARSYLARFLFRGEDALKPVSELSGGERSRLELALLGVTSANLLLLDEPTNHLDIPAREALETFLRDWPGTLLVVSHDRRLLETLCERLWVVEPGARATEPGEAVEFDGGYRMWRGAVAEGWTVRGELEKTAHRFGQRSGAHANGNGSKPASAKPATLSSGVFRQNRERPFDRTGAPLEGRLRAAIAGGRGRSDPPRAAKEPAGACAWRSARPGELHRAAKADERARGCRCCTGPGRGRLALARGASATVNDSRDEFETDTGRSQLDRLGDRPFLIGLTGPIGCGKSTVAQWLGERGGTVIDADVLAREATADGEPTIDPIRLRFGDAVFHQDGSLDRAALARIVFSDERALRDLERIVHPHVRRRVLDRLDAARAAGDPFVVIEAIKLVEGGLADQCDEVWLVECGSEAQRTRLEARGMAPDEIDRRTSAQGDLVARLGPRTTRRIRTDGSLAETEQLVEKTLADALAPVLLD